MALWDEVMLLAAAANPASWFARVGAPSFLGAILVVWGSVTLLQLLLTLLLILFLEFARVGAPSFLGAILVVWGGATLL